MNTEKAKKAADTLKMGAALILLLGIALVVLLIFVAVSNSGGITPEFNIALSLDTLCFILIGMILLMSVCFSYLLVFLSSYLKLKAEQKENE